MFCLLISAMVGLKFLFLLYPRQKECAFTSFTSLEGDNLFPIRACLFLINFKAKDILLPAVRAGVVQQNETFLVY